MLQTPPPTPPLEGRGAAGAQILNGRSRGQTITGTGRLIPFRIKDLSPVIEDLSPVIVPCDRVDEHSGSIVRMIYRVRA